MIDLVNCNILNTVEDDFQTIWEIKSVIKNKLNEQDDELTNEFILSSLKYLLLNKLIKAYEGYNFQGEESEIVDFKITLDFIILHNDDWKNTEYKGSDIRFYITQIGIDYLSNNCKKIW